MARNSVQTELTLTRCAHAFGMYIYGAGNVHDQPSGLAGMS